MSAMAEAVRLLRAWRFDKWQTLRDYRQIRDDTDAFLAACGQQPSDTHVDPAEFGSGPDE